MIHLNIGSNLDSSHGSRFNNITIAINLLIEDKIKIKKISNFYETPSYPNQNFPKFLNVGLIVNYKNNYFDLFKKIKFIEKKLGRIRAKKNDPRVIDGDDCKFEHQPYAGMPDPEWYTSSAMNGENWDPYPAQAKFTT